jgi:hypothetical protein
MLDSDRRWRCGQKSIGDKARVSRATPTTQLTRALRQTRIARTRSARARPDDTAVVQGAGAAQRQEYNDRVYKGDLGQRVSSEPITPSCSTEIYWAAYSRAPSHRRRKRGDRLRERLRRAATTQPVGARVWFDDELPPAARRIGPWKIAGRIEQPGLQRQRLSHRIGGEVPANPSSTSSRATKSSCSPDRNALHLRLPRSRPTRPKEIMLQIPRNGDWQPRRMGRGT